VEGKAPGYPAAAAATPKSSCKIEEKLTASRPRYGRLMTLSGFEKRRGACLPIFVSGSGN
jgi:hypothetical protein